MFTRTRKALLGASLAVLAAALSTQAMAQQRRFDIPAQDAATAVTAFGLQAGVQISAPVGQLRGVKTAAVRGDMDARAALKQLIAGTGLVIAQDDGRTIVLQMRPQDAAAAEPAQVAELLVTGSRLRGAPPSSQVITLTAEEMRNAGQHDLGEVVRAIPQNFGGGQNPGAGGRNTIPTSGAGNGSSTLNLRGIGNDATLTLLNGHRLATNRASGVDISAIPIAAVDRIEILTDGASALYGSDAVGGVANIIVRPDRDAITARVLYGASTDGGFDQTLYSATVEKTWTGGGLIVAANMASNGDITSGQRSYTTNMNRDVSLYPDQNRFNVLTSVRQAFGDNLTAAVDALYTNTDSELVNAFGAGRYTASGSVSTPTVRSYLVAPSLDWKLGSWLLSLNASYGLDNSRGNQANYTTGRPISRVTSCYCNTSSNFELNAEGPFAGLPAGEARLAAGAGYRTSRTEYTGFTNGVANTTPFAKSDDVTYAYGELGLPLVAAEQSVPYVRKLQATAAVRYEDYPEFGSVTTPKLGLIYEIIPAVTVKGSWGKSFKAPSFAQRYAESQILLYPVTGYGALYPTTATLLRSAGGDPDLKPERATSRTVSIEFHPTSVRNLHASLSYFGIDFKDRVIAPIPSQVGALTNPLLADLITLNPTLAQQAAVIARASTPLVLATTVPYDPSRVVALMDARFVNATAQTIEGIDASLRFRLDLENGNSVSFSSSAAYLDVTQQRIAGEPTLGVTGNFYQPRHFRSRAGASWQSEQLTLSAYANYVGAARFRSVTPILELKSTSTLDLIAQWSPRFLDGLNLALSINNALNNKPTTIPGAVFDSSFDATAYDVTGRYVSLSIAKSW
jgi:outer membrane receptor protein involved in Fe transport